MLHPWSQLLSDEIKAATNVVRDVVPDTNTARSSQNNDNVPWILCTWWDQGDVMTGGRRLLYT